MNKLFEFFKKWAPWLILSIVLLAWLSYLIEWFPWWLNQTQDRGKFGDSFGSLNALFSGLAFLGVIWAILLQKRELGLQRKELGLQRKNLELQQQILEHQQQILEHQRKELQEQKETLQKQNFESSFFQLLGLYSEIVNSMEFQRVDNEVLGEYSGRKCFGYMHRKLREGVSYEQFFAEYQLYLGHYFRHLYNVIKFVDQNEFLENLNEQQFYTNLIRAQLSTDELGVLFYHGQNEPGAKFKDLIERYALFKDMRPVLQNGQTEEYAASAYGESG